MAFFEVKPGDRVRGNHPNPTITITGKVGVCVDISGMHATIVWDGETEEQNVNAYFLSPEKGD